MSNFRKMTKIKAILMSSKKCQSHRTFRGGGEGIEVTGKQTSRFLPRAVQQLELLPRVYMISHFLHPRADKKPHFYSPRAKQLIICDLELTET